MSKFILWTLYLLPALAGVCQDIPNTSLFRKGDGQSVALSDCIPCTAVVIIFTSPECPFDGYYADRLRALSERYAGKVSFYFINPDETAEASPSASFSALPLYTDPQRQLVKILDPRKTPEAFQLKKLNTKLTLVYRGAIDDNPQMATAVTQPWLQTALENLLEGKVPGQAEVRATGCTIRKK